MAERKSLSMILILVAFVGGFVAFAGLMGKDLSPDTRWIADLVELIEDKQWLRALLWLVLVAAALAVVLPAGQIFASRLKKAPVASSMVRKGDLTVTTNAALNTLPAYRDTLRALCEVKEPRAIDVLNHLLSTGLSLGASDIHLSPGLEGTRTTLRIHGLLYDMGVLPASLHLFLISRIKVVSDLAIFKKNTPQDGRIRLEDERYTARVSVLPTNHGEKVVMRLASQDGGLYELSRLGLDEELQALYEAVLNRNQGVVILTGPTGSGKTTTLYASLLHVNKTRGHSVNIVTLEDPIEFDFPSFSQTQVEVAQGLTFAVGLRSILRQDPDVIMVGEIRDEETASNAMRAAMTGHLIFTTVHANSAAGVFGRLVQIGIEPVHLGSAILAVISQRLCQRLCPHCQVQVDALTRTQQKHLSLLGVQEMPAGPFYTSEGCDHCLGLGFIGLTPLYEMLVVKNTLRDAITGGVPAHTLQKAAIEDGMNTLLDDGLRKARRGEVSLDEVLRVVNL